VLRAVIGMHSKEKGNILYLALISYSLLIAIRNLSYIALRSTLALTLSLRRLYRYILAYLLEQLLVLETNT
jgi:hypothetical protein